MEITFTADADQWVYDKSDETYKDVLQIKRIFTKITSIDASNKIRRYEKMIQKWLIFK